VAGDGPEQNEKKFGVGRCLAIRRGEAGAADAGEHLGDDLAAGGAVRRGQAGALMDVGDGREDAADRGRGFSGYGKGGEVDGDQGGGGGQGRGAALMTPREKAASVAVIGAAGGGGAAGLHVAAGGADLGVADQRGRRRGLVRVEQRCGRGKIGHDRASPAVPSRSKDYLQQIAPTPLAL
jgi:hypothetical protein